MNWWCSAQNVPWTWTWQAYPGVWLFVLALAGAYLAGLRWLRPPGVPAAELGVPWRQRALFLLGVALLWAVADWPVGVLAAGYLVSVHALQNLVVTLAVPPLLLLGTPEWLARETLRRLRLTGAVRLLTHPLAALAVVNGVLVVTHLPAVVDGVRGTQLGGFAVDVLWLFAGLVLWWPVAGPLPELNRLSPFWAMGYLFLQSLVPTVPASFLTFAPYPIYGLYELAPRVHDISARTDQQVAGLLMKLGGGFLLWGVIAVIFFRWAARDAGGPDGPPSRADVTRELADLGLLLDGRRGRRARNGG
ncbi:MAG TPA: cytochrome c oxidase assembly protein [Thermaerobacter sp.]